MAYADYIFYTNSYFGSSISEEDWPSLSERASEYLDYITQGRAAGMADLPQLKKALCALAESYQVIDRARLATISGDGEMSAQTVGSWSATYRSGAESAGQYQGQLYAVAQRYLADTGLLSRAGGCHRCTCLTLRRSTL